MPLVFVALMTTCPAALLERLVLFNTAEVEDVVRSSVAAPSKVSDPADSVAAFVLAIVFVPRLATLTLPTDPWPVNAPLLMRRPLLLAIEPLLPSASVPPLIVVWPV